VWHESVREQGSEEDIWVSEEGSNRRQYKIAKCGTS
jgi:hypothetical protein